MNQLLENLFLTKRRSSYTAAARPIIPREERSLDTPLLYLSENPLDTWRIRDACERTQIIGATGSGKTTGSGQALARTFLRNDFGGVAARTFHIVERRA
jgi:hypothetical protein